MTVRELYQYAANNRILDAPIRICDGMAISYYPKSKSLVRGRYEVIIDVSDLEPIEYDELNTFALPELQDDIY